MIIEQLTLFGMESGSNLESKESDENYTGSDVLNLVHQFYGYPDLDPFSCEFANRTVKAKQISTVS